MNAALQIEVRGEAATRETILALQEAMTAEIPEEERMDIPSRTSHYFAPGLYCRQFELKAGEVIIGKIHKHAHLITLVHGTVDIVDEFNNVRMTGPQTWVSTPGVKRAIYAHSDTMFLTFHPTEETDLVKIEHHVIAPTYEALEAFRADQLEILL